MVTEVKLSPLRPLAPVPLAPQCVSQRGQVVVALKKIDRIVVSRPPGEKDVGGTYIMELVLRPESRIPTSNLRARLLPLAGSVASRSAGGAGSSCAGSCAASSAPPTLRVEKKLAAFGELRNTLYSISYSAHNVTFCAFCKNLIEWAVWGHVEPGALARLIMNEDKMARTLEKFVSELVDLMVHCSTPEGGIPCAALSRIPPLVHEFLFDV
jgi:hypothetical protein